MIALRLTLMDCPSVTLLMINSLFSLYENEVLDNLSVIGSLFTLFYRNVKPIDAMYGIIREMAEPDTVR